MREPGSHTSYLFSEIAARVAAFSRENPGVKLLRLGIGDVTRSIGKTVIAALMRASAEMGEEATFRGYAPSGGYDFLREAVRNRYYPELDADGVFISEGSKRDAADFQALFGRDAVVAVADPVYPVYADASRLAERKVLFMPCRTEDGYQPAPPETHVDLIYLCSPNNPTSAVLSRDTLERFVAYARRERAVLFFDTAYRDYVTDADAPRSIYAIDGARAVACECGSFSKGAGFTGLRCAWLAVPKETGLREKWARRQATVFNGVAYPVQRAAEAALTAAGVEEWRENVSYYLENARLLSNALGLGGQVNAPYLWARCPEGLSGWAWFDRLLREEGVVCTPGEGFGACGKGHVRFSAFGKRDEIEQAARALKRAMGGRTGG